VKKKNTTHPKPASAVLLTVLLGLVLVFGVVASNSNLRGKSKDLLSAVLATVLVDLTNADRATANLDGLTVNPLLENAARMKADDMAQKGYFAHNTPDGKTPWYWFIKAGYLYKYAGENLAVNFTESSEVEKAWMASPTHRLNILGKNYTEIGIATSTGMYQGKEVIFVVQMFGRPK
jgi:uncharacterized protein YkwD